MMQRGITININFSICRLILLIPVISPMR